MENSSSIFDNELEESIEFNCNGNNVDVDEEWKNDKYQNLAAKKTVEFSPRAH
jgi:hypothetical protein